MEEDVALPISLAVRRRFASHLSGTGVEIGPGHVPFPVPPDVIVRYVDRWEPGVNESLFPELGQAAGFPKPDIVANLDLDRLSTLAEGSQDFVIASHVLEHLANPIAMLVEIHRVLREDGLLILLLPDRHKTFDRERAPTPLSHLVDEFQRDVTEVDDAHILDFLIGTRGPLGDTREIEMFIPAEMADEFELNRRRSVHAHVWDAEEFVKVLDFAAKSLGLRWKVVDTMPPGAEGSHGDEFGWVLARIGKGLAIRSRRPRSRWLRRQRNESHTVRRKRTVRLAVYTAIAGDYDPLREHPHIDGVDWIAFTDRPADAARTDWEWRQLVIDPTDGPRQRAKWYKINAHLALPEYDRTLWVDGSVQFHDSDFITMALESDAAWTVFAHPDRNCVYDEAIASRGLRKYDGCPIEEQVAYYRSIDHPEHWGLWCMTLMARNHRQPETTQIEKRLWAEVDRWPTNDQIAFPVVFRQSLYRPAELSGDFWNNKSFSHNMQFSRSDHDR